MSHITTGVVQGTLADVEAALRALGVPADVIHKAGNGQIAMADGYAGDAAGQTADLVVRRADVSRFVKDGRTTYHDAGWKSRPDGTVEAVLDPSDWRLVDLPQEVAIARLQREARRKGINLRRIESRDASGRLVVELAPATQPRTRAPQRARARR